MMQLFDTHTHFDVADFDHDRQHLAVQAKQVGVEALVLIGFIESRFDELIQTHQQLQDWENVPQSYLAPGLHPFYIEQHQQAHLQRLEQVLKQHDCVAVGEIEVGVVDVMQEHVDPREVVRGQIDLLTVEPLADVVLAEHLVELQQQRT